MPCHDIQNAQEIMCGEMYIHKWLAYLEALSMHINISVVLALNKLATDYKQLTDNSQLIIFNKPNMEGNKKFIVLSPDFVIFPLCTQSLSL